MPEKIVTLNEEVIKGANQGTGTRKRRRNAERAAGGRSGETDAGGALRTQRSPSRLPKRAL